MIKVMKVEEQGEVYKERGVWRLILSVYPIGDPM